MSTAFGIARVTQETEGYLQRELDLTPIRIDESLARAEGTFRGTPVVIETRAYAGPLIRFARFARITGPGLEIGNVLCLSRPEAALPILGADLVALSDEAAMLAVDLSPVLPPGGAREEQLAPLAALRRAHPELPPGGELPGWCSGWFSPYALYTRFGAALRDRAMAAYLDFPRALVAIAANATSASTADGALALADAGSILDAQSRYLRDHRTEDKGLKMLEKLFGAAWAARYVAEVLFPSKASE